MERPGVVSAGHLPLGWRDAPRRRLLAGRFGRQRIPGADVAGSDVRAVAEFTGRARWAVDGDLGWVVDVGVGVVAADCDPALAELAATAPALDAVQHLHSPDRPAAAGRRQVAERDSFAWSERLLNRLALLIAFEALRSGHNSAFPPEARLGRFPRGKTGRDASGFWGRGEMGKSAAVSLRDANEHEEAAARHMGAAVRCRDGGQVQRAVLEVKYAMLERQLAQLEREKAKLETGNSTLAAETFSAPEQAGTHGAVEVMYRDSHWHVGVHDQPEASSVHEFRIVAIVIAHEKARRARGELVIRGRDGTPREHVSYCDDPVQHRVIYRRPELRRARIAARLERS